MQQSQESQQQQIATPAPAITPIVPIPEPKMPSPAGGLQQTNAHPRDAHIRFFEDGHIYDVKGRRDFVSCTTLVHQFQPEFNAQRTIAKMMSNPVKWRNSKYYGMTVDAIAEHWANNGTDASRRGTLTHNRIEFYYNGWDAQFPYDDPIEYTTQFATFEREVVVPLGYTPYRTEWFVYDEAHELAGSIDMVYQTDAANEPDKIVIYDWKRSTKLSEKENRFSQMKHPLQHLPDTKYWGYALQLNVYRHILETQYGKTVVGLFLVGLHPELPTYQLEQVPMMRRETEEVFAMRKEAICAAHP